MKLKKTLLLISAFSMLSLLSGRSFALKETFVAKEMQDEKNQDGDEIKAIKSKKANLAVDENFAQGGVNYTLYKNLKAFVGKESNKNFKKSFQGNETLEGTRGVNQNSSNSIGGRVLLDKGFFKIYEDNSAQNKLYGTKKSELSDVNNQEEKYIYKVAYNNHTKKFGVLTGNAIIKIDPQKEINLPDSSFGIEKSYRNLGLYVVKIPENLQLKDAIAKLKKANPAEKIIANEEQKSIVNVEVLENFKSSM